MILLAVLIIIVLTMLIIVAHKKKTISFTSPADVREAYFVLPA
ncbi:MAG: hypothetical protein ACLTV6_06900 [Christensenellales bacterium]